jgi:hypothetical protein
MTMMWADVDFTDPKLVALWDPPPGGGVYLILARQPDAGPQGRYRAVYVGETRDFARQVTEAHKRFACWAREAGGTGHLYVAVHGTWEREERGPPRRALMREALVARLDPPCNRE